tara:strand:- start:135 stop:512 length:378 start_codon:yes stop_codon:yes gene_type:complete
MIQFLAPLASLATTWLEGTVEKSKAKTHAEVALKNAEAIVYEKKATADIDWDLEAIKASNNSWKDEWLVILFSIPMIMAFIPGLEGVVARGFEQLDMMPDWYQYSLGVIIAASFGIRSASRFFKR